MNDLASRVTAPFKNKKNQICVVHIFRFQHPVVKKLCRQFLKHRCQRFLVFNIYAIFVEHVGGMEETFIRKGAGLI